MQDPPVICSGLGVSSGGPRKDDSGVITGHTRTDSSPHSRALSSGRLLDQGEHSGEGESPGRAGTEGIRRQGSAGASTPVPARPVSCGHQLPRIWRQLFLLPVTWSLGLAERWAPWARASGTGRSAGRAPGKGMVVAPRGRSRGTHAIRPQRGAECSVA